MMAQTVEGAYGFATAFASANQSTLLLANIMQASKKKLLLDHLIASGSGT